MGSTSIFATSAPSAETKKVNGVARSNMLDPLRRGSAGNGVMPPRPSPIAQRCLRSVSYRISPHQPTAETKYVARLAPYSVLSELFGASICQVAFHIWRAICGGRSQMMSASKSLPRIAMARISCGEDGVQLVSYITAVRFRCIYLVFIRQQSERLAGVVPPLPAPRTSPPYLAAAVPQGLPEVPGPGTL